VIVDNDLSTAKIPNRWAGAMRYTLAEVEALKGATEEALRQAHQAKKAFAGTVTAGPQS
jgi:hypothetical protein